MSYLNEVATYTGKFAEAAREQLRQMQPARWGASRQRAETGGPLAEARELDRDQFDAFLNAAAQKVGHRNDEEQPCSVCAFVMKHAQKGRGDRVNYPPDVERWRPVVAKIFPSAPRGQGPLGHHARVWREPGCRR